MEQVYPGGMASGVFNGIAFDAKAIEDDFANYLPAESSARQKA